MLKKPGILFSFILVFIFVATLVLLLTPDHAHAHAHTEHEEININYYRGEVISIEEHPHEGDFIEREAKLKITTGPYQGDTTNYFYYHREDDHYAETDIEEGMEVILGVKTAPDGTIENIFIHDMVRDRGIYYLAVLFVILLLLVGRKQGWKTLLTIAFTGLVLVKVMLPLLWEGYNPILLSTLCAVGIIVFILLVIGGINAKSFAAILGTACGVLVAGLLAFWIGEVSHLTGFSDEEAQTLFYLGEKIDIRGLLFAGIIIGSLGAVSDVGMSVASAATELKEVNPKISLYQLVQSTMNVGRDIMATMANTLILAYVGSSIPLLLLITYDNVNWLRIINMDLIATEIVRGIAGSIGLVVAIPVTAIIAGIMLNRRNIENTNEKEKNQIKARLRS